MSGTCYFFGTFNPIHWWHLLIADRALAQFGPELGFDTVTFVPAGAPPHRAGEPDLLLASERLAMVSLAVADHPGFRASDIELAMAAEGLTTYTADVLSRLEPDASPSLIPFIIGTDALSQLGNWYQAEQLARRLLFLVAERPGSLAPEAIELPLMRETPGSPSVMSTEGRVPLQTRRIDAPALPLSASWVREQFRRFIADGQTERAVESESGLRYVIPQAALHYLLDNRLYEHWRN